MPELPDDDQAGTCITSGTSLPECPSLQTLFDPLCPVCDAPINYRVISEEI